MTPTIEPADGPAAGKRPFALRRASVAPLVLITAGIALLAWTWGTWPDVLVDFGRELYVPWQILDGKILHRDLSWFEGPLSPYANALLFALFGTSLRTLVAANAVILASVAFLLYRILRRMSDSLAATVAVLVLLAVFGFGQYVGIGNYNWISPYSHGATHGVALAILSLAALGHWSGRRSALWVGLAGFALGLTFLTKAEVFLAALAGAGFALGLFLWREPAARERTAGLTLVFIATALLPAGASFALFAPHLGAAGALRATLGAWPWIVEGRAGDLIFYRESMGLDAPLERLTEIAFMIAAYALALLPALFLAFLGRRRPLPGRVLALAVFLTEGLALLAVPNEVWLRGALPFPLFLAAIACGFAWNIPRREPGVRGQPVVMEISLVVFSLVLLTKMLMNTRIYQYGFVLAMPATLVVVVALVGWIPELCWRRGARGDLFRAAALALVAVGLLRHLQVTDSFVRTEIATVGRGADVFRSDPIYGVMVQAALVDIRRRLPEGGTLAVLPEGVMINYLARRVNPTPYYNFMPPELAMFGEPQIFAAFREHPPDLILLAHKDTSEYGFPFFGRDYGRELYAWVRSEYAPVWLVSVPKGAEPLREGTVFALQLLARSPPR